MTSKKKTPAEELKEKLVSVKITTNLSVSSKEFDAKKFKELAQKVKKAIRGEDLLRLEATI